MSFKIAGSKFLIFNNRGQLVRSEVSQNGKADNSIVESHRRKTIRGHGELSCNCKFHKSRRYPQIIGEG